MYRIKASNRQRTTTTNTIFSFSLSAVVHTCILLTAKQYLIKELLHEEHGITTYKRAFPHLSCISEKRVLVKSSESSFAYLPSFLPSLPSSPTPIPTPDCLFNLILPDTLSLSTYAYSTYSDLCS